jgi:hypothetical protein
MFLAGGGCFIVAGSALAIWLSEPEHPPHHPLPRVAIAGRVVSRLETVGVAGRQVMFVRRDATVSVRNNHWGLGKTDGDGRFRIHGDYFLGPVHVFIARHDLDPWTFRPVKNVILPTEQPVELTIIEGVTIVGRVVRRGVPVQGAPMGLSLIGPPSEQFSGFNFTETDERGKFVFRHVFEDTELRVFSHVGLLPDHGVVEPRTFRTGRDETTTDLGDLEVHVGSTLAGELIFADGNSGRPRVILSAFSPGSEGYLVASPDATGHFEFKGLPRGPVTLSAYVPPTGQTQALAMIRAPGASGGAYQLSPKNVCRNPTLTTQLEGRIDRDIRNLTVLLEPAVTSEPSPTAARIAPSVLARFERVRAGPITGVPPPDSRF